MSVDTHAKLKGKIPFEEVKKVIEKLYGEYGNVQIVNPHRDDWEEIPSIKERYDDSGRWRTEMCHILFHTSDHALREMFCLYYNVNFYENFDYYKELGLENMVKAETTFLSLGKWGQSIEILKAVTEHFGGWLDEDDCDDIPYYWIDKVVDNG